MEDRPLSIITRDVTREHFEQYPVWAEYESPDDRESILTWGEKGAQIVRKLEAVGFSDTDSFPLLQLDEDWEGFRCAEVRATVTAADGTEFPGCVSVIMAPYLRLFAADKKFGFNTGLPEYVDKELL